MLNFIKIVGIGWAIIGFGNLFLMPWTTSSNGFLMFGFIFNMVCFVLPGLLIYGVCAGRRKVQQ